ncbi:MAG: CoA transferase [Alphaproteobacteria bacterium]|nr:CoA transferase [Alphaproteobacteria bacterium]
MLPLQGIRVVEFTNILSGPFCGMLLSDMGADVIKIEKPTGDDMRYWPPITDGYSENFASVNRNKRSIALDLKDKDDLQLARDLCQRADVLVENNRPGAMDRLGLGYKDLKERNPKLLYCSISAFGSDGPYAHRGGFDLVVQAESGIMSVTGEDDPVKCGVPISDVATGLYGAFAIAAALREVEKSGKGAHIEASMLGASIGIAALQTSEFFGRGSNSPRMGSRHPRNAPYQAFKASDGYFALAAGNDKLYRDVCKIVGREDLLERDEFRTTERRAANQYELADILEVHFAGKSAQEWIDIFGPAGVPCGLINDYKEALSHPQVEHCGWVQPMKLPNGVETKTFLSPVRFDLKTTPMRSNPPALNEHGEQIRAEMAKR